MTEREKTDDEALRAPAIEPVLGGKYRIERALGEGGFAWVWLARHETIRSLRFAVKVLKAEHAENPEVARRFRREAETAAALQNRHVVRVVDYGETASGCPFIVMEYVDGVPLESLLARRGPLRPSDCARLTLDVLRALEEAHRLGIVHRDLKPANIYVVEEAGHRHPIARVLDFGIAKVMAGEKSPLEAGTQTVGGVVYCTPQYASPELLNGVPSPRSDLYALGHVMAEMLDGHAPFADIRNSILVAAEQLAPRPVPLGDHTMSSGLRAVVARALAKDENERFASATEMADALQEAYRAICPHPEQEPPLAIRGTDPARSPVPTGSLGEAPDTPAALARPSAGASGSAPKPAQALRAADAGGAALRRGPAPSVIHGGPVDGERDVSGSWSVPDPATDPTAPTGNRRILVAFAALALFVIGVGAWLASAALGPKPTTPANPTPIAAPGTPATDSPAPPGPAAAPSADPAAAPSDPTGGTPGAHGYLGERNTEPGYLNRDAGEASPATAGPSAGAPTEAPTHDSAAAPNPAPASDDNPTAPNDAPANDDNAAAPIGAPAPRPTRPAGPAAPTPATEPASPGTAQPGTAQPGTAQPATDAPSQPLRNPTRRGGYFEERNKEPKKSYFDR